MSQIGTRLKSFFVSCFSLWLGVARTLLSDFKHTTKKWIWFFVPGLAFLSAGFSLSLAQTSSELAPAPMPTPTLEAGAPDDVASNKIPIRFSLDWRWEGTSAPFAVALDKGYFEEEGLEVIFDPAAGSREAVGRLIAQTHDMAFADINTLIRAYGQRQKPDSLAVMMVYDIPPLSIIGRKSRGITQDIKSLEGKKIGAPDVDTSYNLWDMLKSLAPLDDKTIQFVNVGFAVRDLMLAQGELDAVFGYSMTSVINLIARGTPANDIVVLKYADHGIKLYGNAIIVSKSFATKHPEAVEKFLRAYLKGLKDVIADPALGAAAASKQNEIVDPNVEEERIQLFLKNNILSPWVLEHGLGNIDPERMNEALRQLEAMEPFKDTITQDMFFTDQFLPPLKERFIPVEEPPATPPANVNKPKNP